MENEDNKNNNNNTVVRKPRFLCLHGFRTSGEIMKKQIHKWPQNVLDKLDLVFVDAPFPCNGKSDVEGIFDPPYYEWFQFNKVFFFFLIIIFIILWVQSVNMHALITTGIYRVY
jgi:hypothetical protein